MENAATWVSPTLVLIAASLAITLENMLAAIGT
jgi:hypothetical protein